MEHSLVTVLVVKTTAVVHIAKTIELTDINVECQFKTMNKIPSEHEEILSGLMDLYDNNIISAKEFFKLAQAQGVDYYHAEQYWDETEWDSYKS